MADPRVADRRPTFAEFLNSTLAAPVQALTQRDYFAAAALQGWIATYGESNHPADNSFDQCLKVARLSYQLADAMLFVQQERDPKVVLVFLEAFKDGCEDGDDEQ
jgi:hypothetical protein